MPDRPPDPPSAPRPSPPPAGAPAGPLAAWLAGFAEALEGTTPATVPCDGCTACCTASQFVPIGPDEVDVLARIPAGLAVPAPGRPGWRVLGYDEQGRCPMLVAGACSIYDHRPRTCRTYDCRVFAATGVEPAADQPAIAERARSWVFGPDEPGDADRRAALRAAVDHVRARAAEPGGDDGPAVPTHPTQVAVLAVEIHGAFLTAGDDGDEARRRADRALRQALAPRRRGDDRRSG